MNAFTNYEPQIKWKGIDTPIKRGLSDARAAARKANKPMIDLPPLGSINTDETRQSDKTDMIRRGGR